MKELSQIRKAVLDALRGAGIQAMEVFPEKKAMGYRCGNRTATFGQ